MLTTLLFMNTYRMFEYIKTHLGLSADDLAELLNTNRFALYDLKRNNLSTKQIDMLTALIATADQFIQYNIIHPERIIKTPAFAGYSALHLLKSTKTLTHQQLSTLRRMCIY